MNPFVYRALYTAVSVVSATAAKTVVDSVISKFKDDTPSKARKPRKRVPMSESDLEILVEYIDATLEKGEGGSWEDIAYKLNNILEVPRSGQSYRYYYRKAKNGTK